MKARTKIILAWFAWAVIVFGAMNVYAPPYPSLLGEPLAAQRAERVPGLATLLVMMRDDGDTRRYFAYARAVLGLPLDGFYLAPDAEGKTASEDAHVLVTPAHPLWPWRDFAVEYPPGVLLAAVPPALFATDFASYHLLFSIFMGLLLTIGAGLAVKTAEKITPGAGADTLWLALAFVAALGVASVRRYDALVAVSIAAAMYAVVARRAGWPGVWLGLATIAKGVPLLLAPVGLLFWARERRGRELALAALATALTLALAAAIYVFVAGPRAFDSFAYHLDRPVQVESPYGAALMLGDIFVHSLAKVSAGHGSENVVSALEPSLRPLSTLLTGVAILAVLAWGWRALARATSETARLQILLAAGTAILIAYIALGKVFSPQYLIWLLPTGAVAAALSSERSRVLFIFAALITQIEFPYLYFLDSPWSWQLLAFAALVRDGLLIAVAVSLMADAAARDRNLIHSKGLGDGDAG